MAYGSFRIRDTVPYILKGCVIVGLIIVGGCVGIGYLIGKI
jgi:hypothetical protein